MGSPKAKASNAAATGETSLVEVASRKVRRRRLERRVQWAVLWFGVVLLLVVVPVISVAFFPGQGPLPGDPLRYYLGVIPVVAVMSMGAWYHTRKTILAVNRVAIGTNGFYPPFKPKQRLSKTDWFVSYKDIVSMTPVAEKEGFVPAYDVNLADGFTFQLNALDLLLYVDEKEVRRYAKMLAVIKEELERRENRARAEKGEDVIIPKERFEDVLKSWKPTQEAPVRSMFWHFVTIGLVAGLVAALIIGFGILR